MLKDHHTETTVLVLAIVMGFLMAAAVMLLDGIPFNASNLFKIWAMITLVILLVSIFVPYKVWSAKFCRLIGCKPGTLAWKLADGIVPSLILNTFNTFVVSAANIFYNDAIPASEQFSHWIHGCLRDWPITFVISYFVAFVAEACGKLVADRVAKREET
jgi:hypothetical protein